MRWSSERGLQLLRDSVRLQQAAMMLRRLQNGRRPSFRAALQAWRMPMDVDAARVVAEAVVEVVVAG